MLSVERIQANLDSLQAELRQLSSNTVTIIPVTKKHSAEIYQALASLRVEHVAENRVQELQEKLHYVTDHKLALKIHFIGPLQKNKVKYIAGHVHSIDSLASVSLLKEIEKRYSNEELTPVEVLLQVNSTGEENKAGLLLEDFASIIELTEKCQQSNAVRLAGLMTMGPTPGDGYSINDQAYLDDTRAAFEKTRILYERIQSEIGIKFSRLSMGMSHDYRIAVEEGSNEIRIGTLLLGPRPL